MSLSKIVAGVDVGTTKTTVLLAEVHPQQRLNLLSWGEVPTQGIRKGEIVNLEKVRDCFCSAMQEAEKQAQTHVRNASFAMSGYHLKGQQMQGTATVSDASNQVSESDIERAKSEVNSRRLRDGRVKVQEIAQPYFLDKKMRPNPLGLTGLELEASSWVVDGDERCVREWVSLAQAYSLRLRQMTVASLASAWAVTDETDRQHGTLVVDIGGGTTDFVLFHKGYVVCTGVLPIGGEHITNDLALGLRMSVANAEKIKLEFGKALEMEGDANQTIWLHGDKGIGDRKLRVQAISRIVHARVDELFGIIRRRLDRFLNKHDVAAGVVLTGGSAQLRLIEHAATRALGVEARIGEVPEWLPERFKAPQYATVVGLLQEALAGWKDQERPVQKKTGFAQGLRELFRI